MILCDVLIFMSDTPPKVKEVFIAVAVGAIPILLVGIVSGGLPKFNVVEMFCLGVIGLFFATIFLSYKWLERHREKNSTKETVQKLGLDD